MKFTTGQEYHLEGSVSMTNGTEILHMVRAALEAVSLGKFTIFLSLDGLSVTVSPTRPLGRGGGRLSGAI
jgi:hypothetical protein